MEKNDASHPQDLLVSNLRRQEIKENTMMMVQKCTERDPGLQRSAVQQMAKFVALKKVPIKNDCLLCISKKSPVLSTRTWKDIK